MTAAKTILELIPLAQSTAILAENVKFSKKKDKEITDFVGVGAKNIVGIELTKAQADLISSF